MPSQRRSKNYLLRGFARLVQRQSTAQNFASTGAMNEKNRFDFGYVGSIGLRGNEIQHGQRQESKDRHDHCGAEGLDG
jgi:hypothetical protein